ncbi:alpha/beta hydrolase [Streptomyces sp. Je 1-79]|uniref:alpha/beta hydrolase n=1 Tax=Streptomyces sp. Je 1-79 TaxID=2943847 RepID=UPI0021A38B5F|nr:alpha/beta hydrolase [Streptomyces sp. Je 1-79]MCT4356865.1 alpha/beta hydrolase [Streptomyces sp. Je 1-79]
MTTYAPHAARNALLTTLSAAAVVAGLTAPAPAAASAPASPPATLAWTDCADDPRLKPRPLPGQECATLSVPLDYGDPGGRQVGIAVSRLRSERPGERRGALAVIPGGPGSSGVQRLTLKGEALRRELGGAYDLVAMDPRGVGGSVRANCRLDEDDRRIVNLRSWPDAEGGIAENVARSRRTAEACARNGGEELASMTTANQARDLDRFRRALGEERLSAWGVSYGTYVGAVYAQKFPHRTDRWVLDSSSDPDPERVARGWLAYLGQGAQDRFPDFATWAAHPDRAEQGLRLAERAEDVRPLVIALAERLDRAPVETTTPGVPLTGNLLRQALQNALYSDTAFAGFARLVVDARHPDRTPALPPELASALPQEDAAIMVGVICNDVRWPASVPAHRRAVAAERARHPLTAGFPANITPCSFWKAPAERPTRITDRGPSNILMVQSLRDPSTPYAAGLRMRAALGDRARLVTVDQGGHGMYLGNGNACGDRAVTEFLRTGERPARDTYCANRAG